MQRHLDADAAADMLARENSGFSVDASVRITLIRLQLRVYCQPLEHLLRYCARPRKHRHRYHGVFAPNHLMARVGEEFPFACPGYGGDIRLLAFITDPGPIRKILTHLGEPLEPPPVSPARGPPADWGELVQVHDDRAIFQASPDELPVIDIRSLCRDPMPRCGRPVRRAVSRPVCADEKNSTLSVDRTLIGTSTVGPHTARSVPAVAHHDLPRSADACRSAIGRPIHRVFAVDFPVPTIGTFDAQLVEVFWESVAATLGANFHAILHHGRNGHHIAEAVFKAAARALRIAVEPDPRQPGITSTKGTLTSS